MPFRQIKDLVLTENVLTDDLERSAKEIVWLIFNRWIQENDFKYIDKHMGMKQITSYLYSVIWIRLHLARVGDGRRGSWPFVGPGL